MINKFKNENQILALNGKAELIYDLLNLLSDFDISHEIRTPLTVIKGFVELLLNSNDLNFVQQQNLQIILKNEERLESVIQKIEKVLGEFRKKE